MISANTIGDMPRIDGGCFVDPSARIIGNVHIACGCYIGPYAVIRADEVGADGRAAPICIGEETNVQDTVVIHSLAGEETTIGRRCSIAHGAIVHGPCVIGDNSFVGFRSVVYNSMLGREVLVGSLAVVQGVELSEGSLVKPGSAILSESDVEQLVSEIGSGEREFMEDVVEVNLSLVKGYKIT